MKKIESNLIFIQFFMTIWMLFSASENLQSQDTISVDGKKVTIEESQMQNIKNCHDRRLLKVSKLGFVYENFSKKLKQSDFPDTIRSFYSGCIEADSSVEEKDSENLQLVVHEGVHMLGSAFQETKGRYEYYIPSSQSKVVVKRIESLPPPSIIHDLIQRSTYLTRKNYVEPRKNNTNDLYTLVDEWNAYYEGYVFEKVQYQSCASSSQISDNGNGPIEMAIYTGLYLRKLRKVSKIKFQEVSKLKSFTKLVSDLVKKTEKTISEHSLRRCHFNSKITNQQVKVFTQLKVDVFNPLLSSLELKGK